MLIKADRVLFILHIGLTNKSKFHYNQHSNIIIYFNKTKKSAKISSKNQYNMYSTKFFS